METTIWVLTILKILTIALAVVFLAVTWRAIRKHRSRSLATFFLAILLITIGTVAEGLAFQGLGLTLDEAHIVEALFSLGGFIVLVGSLASSRREARVRPRPDAEPQGAEDAPEGPEAA